MITWKQALREGAVSGSLASILSAAYLVYAGERRSTPAAPVNAISHWFFGRRAIEADQPSLLYTVTGYLVHHCASMFWGVLSAKAWGSSKQPRKPLEAAAGSVVTAGVACFVDYQLTPKRLSPGFEHRLKQPEMVNVYACFALGLAVGTLLMRRR